MPKGASWNLLTGAVRLCYTELMLLQTWVQLHILLSAAPALAGWMPYVHALPLVPGQAVYGVRAAQCPIAAEAHSSVRARLAPAAHGLMLPSMRVRQAQGLTTPRLANGASPYRQNVLAAPYGPRAP